MRERVAVSYIQIADGFFIGARSAAEVARSKMFINHSCMANLGIRGQIIFEASGSGVSDHHRGPDGRDVPGQEQKDEDPSRRTRGSG